jgi:hypothetical protein
MHIPRTIVSLNVQQMARVPSFSSFLVVFPIAMERSIAMGKTTDPGILRML